MNLKIVKSLTRFVVLFLGVMCLRSSVIWARPFEKIPEAEFKNSYQQKILTSADGATIRVTQLRRPHAPIFVGFSGLGTTHESLEVVATEAYFRGFDVLLFDIRGTFFNSSLAAHNQNSLARVCEFDFSRALDYVFSEHATADQLQTKVILFGHSQGGIVIRGGLSREPVFSKYSTKVALALFQSPHHLFYMNTGLKLLAQPAVLALQKLEQQNIKTLPIFSFSHRTSKYLKNSDRNFLARLTGHSFDHLVLLAGRLITQPVFTHSQKLRRIYFKGLSETLAVGVLKSFALALAHPQGRFLDEQTQQEIFDYKKLSQIPTQLFVGAEDTLAPLLEQHQYFIRINQIESNVQLVQLKEMNHLDPVLITHASANFYYLLWEFAKNPWPTVKTRPLIVYQPKCESLFTQWYHEWLGAHHIDFL